MKKQTQEDFLRRAKEVHGDKYDYSKSIYVNADTCLVIICLEHGEFEQKPSKHILSRQGCWKCAKSKAAKTLSSNTEEFIKKAKSCHDDRYDYSLVEYKNSQTHVRIICKSHGIFSARPLNF
jgi:hypothetical protein